MSSEFAWDQSRFDAALSQYIQASSRDVPVILNTKAYYIARRALWNTTKSTKTQVKGFKNLPTTRRQRAPVSGGLMIGALVSKRGGIGKGLYGKKMAEKIATILAARGKSTAFLKSGWLTAIRGLDPKAEEKGAAAPMDPDARASGQGKGDFSAASDGSHVARIVNSAIAKHDNKNALERVGGQALQIAFDSEAASMEEYVLKKMAKRAAEAQAHL